MSEKSNLTIVPFDKHSDRENAKGLLQEAIAKDFDTVCVIGKKDGKIHVQFSADSDALETIGMLEFAKLEKHRVWGESS